MKGMYTSITTLLFITPLLMSPITKEVFELPKTLFLYIVAGLLLVTIRGKFKIKQGNILYILILGTTIISTIFSSYTYNSIFGYYTRFNGGLLSIISYFIIAIIISNNIKLDKKVIEKSINMIIFIGLLVSIYSILQRFGIDNKYWVNDSSLRTFATLGQPNWLSAYLIPVLFLSIWKGFKNSYLWIIASGIIYAGFWFAYSLSGITAFTISFIIFLLLIRQNIKQHIFYILSTIIFFFIISITFIGTFEHRLLIIKENLLSSSIVEEAKAIEYAPETVKTEDTGNIRLILWKGSLKLITSSKKQFLIGSGPQTFVYAISQFMPKEIQKTTEATFIHNKPHNWFVELTTDLGILGLSIYLIFIFKNSFDFIKHQIRQNKRTEFDTYKSAFFAGWVSVLISSFFGWPTVSTMLMFFLWPLFFNNKYDETE